MPGPSEMIVQGVEALTAGDLPRARGLLESALRHDPSNAEAWMWLAGATTEPLEAVRCLEKALELDPLLEGARSALLVARYEAGVKAAQQSRRAEARQLLQQVCRDDPRHEGAWLWLASTVDEPETAIHCLETALRLNPNNQRARAGIEHFRRQLRQRSQWFCPICEARAERRFTTCPTCHAVLDLAQGHEALGNPCPDTDRIRRGVQRLTALARERGDFVSHYYLGMALLNLGRPDEAAVHLRAAQKLRPEDAGLATQVRLFEQALAEAPPPTLKLSREQRDRLLENGECDRPRSLLIVDDSATIRKLVTITMEREGFRVAEAGDGREALEVVATEGRPDLFVVDVQMPVMDGFSLCRAIRENPEMAATPVILLTCSNSFLDRMRARMVGTNDYLVKPFQPKALAQAVRQLLPETSSRDKHGLGGDAAREAPVGAH